MIGAWHESRGLYQLTPSVAYVSYASPALIHQRLGHPNLDKLHLLVPSLSNVMSFQCELCQLGRHNRISYDSRVNKHVVSPFVLVHFDIWGPNWVCSTLGYFYFVHIYKPFISLYLGFSNEESFSHHVPTRKQNVVVERKNCHLVETARTLLHHYNVPLCFGETLFLLLVIWIIACLHWFSIIKFLIPS